jgi:predicted RNA-binding protein YlxR (DUF448 family)
MVRVVRTPTGTVTVDQTGKLSGRGTYLCRAPACWQAGLRRETLARALKSTISTEDRAALQEFAATLVGQDQPLAGQQSNDVGQLAAPPTREEAHAET